MVHIEKDKLIIEFSYHNPETDLKELKEAIIQLLQGKPSKDANFYTLELLKQMI